MDSMTSKIGEMLQDPETMEQIRSLAAMFGAPPEGTDPASAPQPSVSAPAAPSVTPPAATQPIPAPSAAPGADLGAMLSPELLGTVMKLAPLLGNMRRETPNTAFLHALRPLLSNPRQKKLDEAIKLMQLMSVLPMLRQTGILSSIL